MKVLYDHQKFSIQRYGGITKYFCEIITRFPDNIDYELATIFSDNYYLEESYNVFKKQNIIPNREFRGKGFLKRQQYKLNKAYSRYCIEMSNFDVLHPTYYDDYFIELTNKPYVITVHDLIHFKFSETFLKFSTIREQMERTIKNASRIIAVSEYTKNDLYNILNIHPDKIDVIHHGYNQASTPLTQNNLIGDYILYVGERYAYKNFSFFIEAIQPLLNQNKCLKLVCVGSSMNREETLLLERLLITEQIITLSVDDKTLANLYANALVFVYPSLYEGFGLPILEAFFNNCPVCLSNTSCFPEIAGNAGFYFDPTDRDSILSATEKMINDPLLRNTMRNLGRDRILNFSWEKATDKTINTYEKTK